MTSIPTSCSGSLLLALSTLGLGTQAACADELPSPSQWELQLGTGSTAYRAAEYSATGQRLNQESGHLRTLIASLGLHMGQDRFQVGIEQSRNHIGYDGQTQTGIPLSTQTNINLSRFDVDWRHQIREATGTTWFSVLGIEKMQLDRLIQATPPTPPLLPIGTQPLREIMDVWVGHIGVQTRTRPSPESGWLLESTLTLRPTLQSRMRVDTYGTFDPVQLTPGKTTDWRLGLQARYTVTPTAVLNVGIRRESFTPAQSAAVAGFKNGVPTAAVQYPGSRQFLSLVSFGVTWAF